MQKYSLTTGEPIDRQWVLKVHEVTQPSVYVLVTLHMKVNGVQYGTVLGLIS